MGSGNTHLLEILSFKKHTIDYSFDKMKEAYAMIVPNVEDGKEKVVTGKDIGDGAWLISCYGELFFLEVTSFFDALARNLTENQVLKKNIHFQNWIEWQYKHNKDCFINHLNKQYDDWYKDFRDIRNRIAHQGHLYYEINHIFSTTIGGGEIGKFEVCTLMIGEMGDDRKVELFDYCNDVRDKLEDMIIFIDKNDCWEKQYEYNLYKQKKTRFCPHCGKDIDGQPEKLLDEQ